MVYDATGKVVKILNNSFQQEKIVIDLSSYDPGIFWIEVQSTNRSWKQKLIVN